MTNLNEKIFALIPTLSEEAQRRIAHFVLQEATRETGETESPEFNLTITSYDDMIGLCKALRTVFNLTLKDAKDAVDDVKASGHHAFLGLSEQKANEVRDVLSKVACTYSLTRAST